MTDRVKKRKAELEITVYPVEYILGSVGSGLTISSLGSGLDSSSVNRASRAYSKISLQY
jgi:hypothetical protein